MEFRVTDTGIGMSAEQLDRLYRPFMQADASTTRKYGGTGLGLAISREFCQMMGGTLSAESELGTGSAFTIRLPGDTPVPCDQLAAAGGACRRGSPCMPKILVVEDNEWSRDMLARRLSRRGYQVICGGRRQARDRHGARASRRI